LQGIATGNHEQGRLGGCGYPAIQRLSLQTHANIEALLGFLTATAPDAPARAEAVRRLMMMGLAGEMIENGKVAKRKK
jgi:hypothetical protein